jgi:hypothetical protein
LRILVVFSLAVTVAASSLSAVAQTTDPKAELRQKLLAQFTLTKLNDDRSDIVTQGTMALLHKGGIGLVPTSLTPPETSTYKNGKVSASFMESYRAVHNTRVSSDGNLKALTLREGAQAWVTAIMVETEGVTFRFFAGKVNGTGYYGDLRFPFPNDAMPSADDVLKTIAEVVTPLSSSNPAISNFLKQTFVLTRLTGDQTDIAKAGSVLVLHKDGLILYPGSVGIWPINAYKDGKITLGPGSGVPKTAQWDPDGTAPGVTRMTMNSGDKFWLVNILTGENGVGLAFYTDEINGHRYISGLFFPFPKDHKPTPEEVLKTISEVITVDSGEGSSNQTATDSAAPSNAPPPPIAPPPPPVDAPPAQPKTIALGMTKDVVIAIMGQPQKVVMLGAKEIDVYPDLKVTYTNGKVTDVQ